VRADHLVLGEPHDVPVAKELRSHDAVFVETRRAFAFTAKRFLARGAFGIVGRTAAVPRLGIRASLLRRSGGRVRPARASRVARARVARLGSDRGRADDRGRETLPPRGRLAPSRRCCRDTLGTARVPRDAAREDARDARREREREARARARGAPPPAHRGGHESRTPDRPPCARTTVAAARDPVQSLSGALMRGTPARGFLRGTDRDSGKKRKIVCVSVRIARTQTRGCRTHDEYQCRLGRFGPAAIDTRLHSHARRQARAEAQLTSSHRV
jgi:hypothetical protein